jgi:hypothetical protein
MYKNFAPKLRGRYLSSNVNITVPGKDGSPPVSVPVGGEYSTSTVYNQLDINHVLERFRKFKTERYASNHDDIHRKTV